MHINTTTEDFVMKTTTPADTFRIRDAQGTYRSIRRDQLIECARQCILQHFNKGYAIRSPSATEAYLQTMLGDAEHEIFSIVFLDLRQRGS